MNVAAILARLGLSAVTPDLAGLRALYAAWSDAVPFCNVRKTGALFADPNGSLPGLDPEDYFQAFLTHGTGGTCWTSSNALHALLTELGFDARRAVGSVFDMGMPNHGTTVVSLDGQLWLVDSSFIFREPLLLNPLRPTIGSDPLMAAEVALEDGSFFVWSACPPFEGGVFFRVLSLDVPESDYIAGYEASRNFGPFNDRLHTRVNRGDRILLMRGTRLYTHTAAGIGVQEMAEEEMLRQLRAEFGYSAGILEEWAATGALEASFRPESPMPPLPERPRPSARPAPLL